MPNNFHQKIVLALNSMLKINNNRNIIKNKNKWDEQAIGFLAHGPRNLQF
jgi:hypothetical protein